MMKIDTVLCPLCGIDIDYEFSHLFPCFECGNAFRITIASPADTLAAFARAKQKAESKCCITKDCTNRSYQGTMIGDLCAPCHAWIVEGKVCNSQAYRNAVKSSCEILKQYVDV